MKEAEEIAKGVQGGKVAKGFPGEVAGAALEWEKATEGERRLRFGL